MPFFRRPRYDRITMVYEADHNIRRVYNDTRLVSALKSHTLDVVSYDNPFCIIIFYNLFFFFLLGREIPP